MGVADEQIRVSGEVKRELERRKRAGESYSEVLERLLDDRTGDFEEGFGRWSDAQAARVREGRKRAKGKRKRRAEKR
jgi:predicted CopG family antitoxin